MSRYTIWCILIFSALFSSVLCTDDRIYFDQQNNPQPVNPQDSDKIQPRFLPFDTNLSIGFGPGRGQSVGISRTKDGLSLSQSTSLGGSGPVAGSQSNSFSIGRGGIGVSDANAYKFYDRSKANSNSYSVGDADASSQADVKDGKVSTGAQSSVGNEYNKVSSGASSSAGNGETNADANASAVENGRYRPIFGQQNPNRQHGLSLFRPFGRPSESGFGLNINVGKYHAQNPNQWQNGRSDVHISKPDQVQPNRWEERRPELHITKFRPSREQPWTSNNCGTFFNKGTNCGRGDNLAQENSNSWPVTSGNHRNFPVQNTWPLNHQNNAPTGSRVSGASASSSASSKGHGFASSHSSSQSSFGPNGPSSGTKNQLHTSGDAESHAQSVAAGLHENEFGQTQGSFSSGNIFGNSQGKGQSSGSAISENRGEYSRGEVNNTANGQGSSVGNANAAGVNLNDPPTSESSRQDDIIPDEFVRSGLSNDETVQTANPGRENPRSQTEGRGGIRKILNDFNKSITGIFRA